MEQDHQNRNSFFPVAVSLLNLSHGPPMLGHPARPAGRTDPRHPGIVDQLIQGVTGVPSKVSKIRTL